ncbi:hypothetical protein M433DRAFT_111125 [Acidomyces richmondensis BFW]|nr:hypothetical protein M433DRAFT_111125 [Acidomyces richmondensis BFW]
MPSYFFHLKLELYPAPAANVNHKRKQIARIPANNPIFLPPPGTDIFRSKLPVHRTGKWPPRKRPNTPRSGLSSDSEPSTPSPRHQSRGAAGREKLSEVQGEALLLPERSANLLKEPHSPACAVAVKPTNEAAACDWRYDSVTIESIDMENTMSSHAAGAGKVSGHAKSSVNGLHTKAVYVPSDLKTTDVGYGVVHLYRDTEETALLGEDETEFDPLECTTLCILAVPSWMMPSDLLGFVGDQAREEVSHFRMIRTGRANKYMVLLKFRSAKKAREWQKANNGRLFSAAEPENCHVVFIRSVEFLSPDHDVNNSGSFPQNTNDPFTPANAAVSANKNLSSKPLAPPPPNLLELPTCPVCLERMDETTGLLTILCQHVFHCACLEKWRGSGCPVCRYTHSPSYTFPYPRPGSADNADREPLCSVCAGTDNLWICLICGNIGCGRYDGAHAYAHYEATSHCYAMDTTTQHVWDYAGDGYVHRLIQSKPDNQLIDLPSRTRHENEAFRAEGGDLVPREKMESMATEYTYLLTSQLEGQRRYFEEQVERAVDKASEASTRAEEASRRASLSMAQLADSREHLKELTEKLSRVEASLAKAEKAKNKFEQMARDMSSKLREEKTITDGLLARVKAAEEKARQAVKEADEARKAREEAEEMNRDLMMTLSGQEKIRELQERGEEVAEGSLSLPEQTKKGKGRKK